MRVKQTSNARNKRRLLFLHMRRMATAYCGQLQVGQVYVMAVLGLVSLEVIAEIMNCCAS